MRPPIIPDPELRKTCSKDFNTGDYKAYDSNPYILLDENFSSDVYDRDLEVFSSRDELNLPLKKAKTTQKSPIRICKEKSLLHDNHENKSQSSLGHSMNKMDSSYHLSDFTYDCTQVRYKTLTDTRVDKSLVAHK